MYQFFTLRRVSFLRKYFKNISKYSFSRNNAMKYLVALQIALELLNMITALYLFTERQLLYLKIGVIF